MLKFISNNIFAELEKLYFFFREFYANYVHQVVQTVGYG